MLSKLEIHKKDGRLLALPIYGPESYPILDITGLDPGKATLVSSSYASMDGAQYQSSKREVRNIVIKLGIKSINLVADVKTLRQQLYNYFSPESDVELRFFDDASETLLISGVVESFESELFVKDPVATISIMCFNPDFHSEIQTVKTSPLNSADISFAYLGNVSTGFVFSTTLAASASSFTLQNTDPNGITKTMEFTFPVTALATGTTITISTVPGDKYAKTVAGYSSSSILWALDSTSSWLEFIPGTNTLSYTSNATTASSFTATYTDKFGGL